MLLWLWSTQKSRFSIFWWHNNLKLVTLVKENCYVDWIFGKMILLFQSWRIFCQFIETFFGLQLIVALDLWQACLYPLNIFRMVTFQKYSHCHNFITVEIDLFAYIPTWNFQVNWKHKSKYIRIVKHRKSNDDKCPNGIFVNISLRD